MKSVYRDLLEANKGKYFRVLIPPSNTTLRYERCEFCGAREGAFYLQGEKDAHWLIACIGCDAMCFLVSPESRQKALAAFFAPRANLNHFAFLLDSWRDQERLAKQVVNLGYSPTHSNLTLRIALAQQENHLLTHGERVQIRNYFSLKQGEKDNG